MTYPTPIRHVFVIFLENAELSSVQSSGPYEMGLAKNYTNATRYYAPCHPSAPEYLAATSGSTWQCGSDAVTAGGYSTNNIGNLTQKAGLSWGGYMESMPTRCDSTDSYPYAARHDPFVYYSDLSGSVCKAHVANFTAWDANVTAGTIPSFAFFSPNLKDDGHDTSVSYADTWLKGWLPKYLNDSWFNSSVWFLTYDEGSTNSGYGSLDGGHLYFTAVSPYTTGGHEYTNQSTHYDLLSTVEWLLGLGSTGHNDSTTSYPAMKGLFHFTNTTTTKYAVTGRVTALATGLGLSGATVAVASGPSATTNASGDYALSLPNGSYSLTASAAGFAVASASLTISGEPATIEFELNASISPPQEYAVDGLVRYEYNSSPVVGAAVSVGGGPTLGTGSEGTFVLEEPNGTYLLDISAAGCVAISTTVTVSGAPVNLTISLSEFDWNVTGSATDSATGQGIAEAIVAVTLGAFGGAKSVVTDSLGHYALGVPNGTFPLSVSAAGYTTVELTATVSGAPITLNAALIATGSLNRYELTGTVTYASNGSSAVGVPVQILPGASATSDAGGQFSALLANGSYTVRAAAPGWSAAPAPLVIAGAPATVALRLAQVTYPVAGVVRFANGTPGVDLDVVVPSRSTATTTAANGSYSLALPNGTFALEVSGPGIQSENLTVAVRGGPLLQNVVVLSVATAGTSPPATGSADAIDGLDVSALAVVLVVGSTVATAIVVLLRRARRRPPPRS